MYDNDYVKEHLDEVFAEVEDLNYRVEKAMVTMDRMRCPLSHADRQLYDEMYNVLCDWCYDHDLDVDDFNLEDIVF